MPLFGPRLEQDVLCDRTGREIFRLDDQLLLFGHGVGQHIRRLVDCYPNDGFTPSCDVRGWVSERNVWNPGGPGRHDSVPNRD